MKKAFSIICCLALMFSLSACELVPSEEYQNNKSSASIDDSSSELESSDPDSESEDDSSTESTPDSEVEVAIQTEERTDTPELNPAPTIEEQVLWEVDGVTITATGIKEDSFWGTELNVLIENNSDKDICVSADAIIINDYMMDGIMSATVTAGNKANDSITLFSSELEAAGIDNIGKIELYLYTYDPETYSREHTSNCITVSMSGVDSVDTESDIGGTTLYDEGGVKIVGQYVDENSFWGSSVLLYIENNTDQDIHIGIDDLAVNGFMMSSIMAQDVYAGKKAITDITLFESELQENNIESIENVETTFRIMTLDYDLIAESGKVSFSVQ